MILELGINHEKNIVWGDCMRDINFFIAKLKYRLMGKNKEIINDYFRRCGMEIGRGTKLASNIMTPEPYLIKIGKNVTISNGVQFVTHDTVYVSFLMIRQMYLGKL